MKNHEYFHVQLFEEGCKECHRGQTYAIMDRDDDEVLGVFFGDKEEAEETCGWMNKAFDLGKALPEVKEKKQDNRLVVVGEYATQNAEKWLNILGTFCRSCKQVEKRFPKCRGCELTKIIPEIRKINKIVGNGVCRKE